MRTTVLVRVAALAVALGLASEAFAQRSGGTFGSRSTGSISGGSRTLTGGSGGSSFGGGSGMGGGSSLGGGSTGVGNSFLIQRRAGQFIGSDSGDIPRMFGGMTNGMGGYGSGSSMRSPYGSSGYGSSGYGAQRGGYGSGYGMQSRSGLRGIGTQTGMRYGIGLGSSVIVLPPAGEASSPGAASGPGAAIAGGPVVPVGPDPFGTMLAEKLSRSNRIAATGPLRVVSRGASVILLGDVASFHDRELAEMYVLLEPGVSSVENRLTVAGAPLPPIEPAPQATTVPAKLP